MLALFFKNPSINTSCLSGAQEKGTDAEAAALTGTADGARLGAVGIRAAVDTAAPAAPTHTGECTDAGAAALTGTTEGARLGATGVSAALTTTVPAAPSGTGGDTDAEDAALTGTAEGARLGATGVSAAVDTAVSAAPTIRHRRGHRCRSRSAHGYSRGAQD